eukprot:COSAG01_NODE_2377_length_7801_cov_4.201117_9_plen_283_part_00
MRPSVLATRLSHAPLGCCATGQAHPAAAESSAALGRSRIETEVAALEQQLRDGRSGAAAPPPPDGGDEVSGALPSRARGALAEIYLPNRSQSQPIDLNQSQSIDGLRLTYAKPVLTTRLRMETPGGQEDLSQGQASSPMPWDAGWLAHPSPSSPRDEVLPGGRRHQQHGVRGAATEPAQPGSRDTICGNVWETQSVMIMNSLICGGPAGRPPPESLAAAVSGLFGADSVGDTRQPAGSKSVEIRYPRAAMPAAPPAPISVAAAATPLWLWPQRCQICGCGWR